MASFTARPVATALGLVAAIVAGEYLARHVLAPSLPVLAAPRVDDMVVCLTPQPELSPELQSAMSRAIALIDTRDGAEVDALFTPEFLAHIPREKGLSVLESVHATTGGHCSWQCTTEIKSPRSVAGYLTCAYPVAERMEITVEDAPPHKVTRILMLLRPVGPASSK